MLILKRLVRLRIRLLRAHKTAMEDEYEVQRTALSLITTLFQK